MTQAVTKNPPERVWYGVKRMTSEMNDQTRRIRRNGEVKRVLYCAVVLIAVVCCVVPVSVCGQENVKAMKEVVVSATRIETPAEEVGSSITVITAEDIETKGYTTVQETLKGTPGLDVSSTGGPGQASSVYLRGAASYQSLVLVDGIEMNDPSGRNRGVNFANFITDNIERIEIIRGPQSTLYGADAMGGVINIITKQGKGKPAFYL